MKFITFYPLHNYAFIIYVYSIRSRVDKFRRTLPLITDLKNSAMRERHWKKVMQTIGRDFDQNSDEFTLDAIADMQMHNFAEEIADISNAATMELAIEAVFYYTNY